MHQLLITADDLGVNTARSHGIFLTFEQGAVTGASLVANANDSERSARHAGHKGVPIGLQLTLTTDSPLSNKDDIASLIDAQGYFYAPKQFFRLLSEGAIEAVHIERELRAQIEWFHEHGSSPTHICSTDWIHLQPMVAPIVCGLMGSYGMRFVRLPNEPPEPFGFEIEATQRANITRLVALGEAVRPLFIGQGIASTDHTRGMALEGKSSQKNLRHIIGKLSEGTTELVVHPGSPTPTGTPMDLDPQRQTELNMLIDPGLLAQLKERKIERTSFANL